MLKMESEVSMILIIADPKAAAISDSLLDAFYLSYRITCDLLRDGNSGITVKGPTGRELVRMREVWPTVLVFRPLGNMPHDIALGGCR